MSAVGGGECIASCPCRFTLKTHSRGGWMTHAQYSELSNVGRKIRNIVITYILFMEIDKVVFLYHRCSKD
jgi:hypothetical protein